MSILIKNMEMPENCYNCPLSYGKLGEESTTHVFKLFCYCQYLNNKVVRTDSRDKDCPLIELPPHGDLIDKRMLINDISNNAFANADVDCKEEYDFWNRVWEYIRKIPVVVESEDKGN